MKETDLVALLRERADIPDDGSRTRVEGVRAKVRRSRLRQAGVTVAAVALVLAGAAYGLPSRQSADPAGPPGDPAPAYLDGYGFTTSAFTALPEKKTHLFHTPEDETFRIYAFCSIGDRRSVGIRITVNDKPWYDGACDRTGTPVPSPRDAWTAFGIEFGRAIRIEAILPDPPADTGEWGIRVGERVPLADYTFPPRPEQLPVLSKVAPEDVLAHSDPDRPDGRVEARVRWTEPGGLELEVTTPGRVEVFVNGVSVLDATFWTYDTRSASTAPVAEWPRLHGLDLAPGEEVTVLVVPERTSGEWQITRWPAPPG